MSEELLKTYIGDSVYVHFDGYSIILTTENGYVETNRICFDPEVLKAFGDWLLRMHALKSQTDHHPTSPETPT